MIRQNLHKLIAKFLIGNSIFESIVAENGKVTLKQFFKHRRRFQRLSKELRESKIDLELFYKSYRDYVIPVNAPLALISQVQRSGGSLLSQLFDGHSEVHAHPHEMMIGYKKKFVWPRIDINDRPERWFGVLFEKMIFEHTSKGYKKGRRDSDTFPFIMIPSLQRKIFLNYIHLQNSITLRDVFDAYMTSYFGAWISNQNYIGSKKFITAFTPRLSEHKENMDYFFGIYPDGRLISLVRNPKNWFPSAIRHVPEKYGNVEGALNQWNRNVQAALKNKARYGDKVCILRFEDLVGKTEAVMRYLSEFLGIKYIDALLVPTFNKIPIKAHTSFKVDRHGVVNSPLSRYKTLSKHELESIDRITAETYSRVLDKIVTFD